MAVSYHVRLKGQDWLQFLPGGSSAQSMCSYVMEAVCVGGSAPTHNPAGSSPGHRSSPKHLRSQTLRCDVSETCGGMAGDGALFQGRRRVQATLRPFPSIFLLTASRDAGMEGTPSFVCLVGPLTGSLCSKNHCGWVSRSCSVIEVKPRIHESLCASIS